ncbi:hypothetical protein E1B28_004118 [Marasmius oreades]|uniref:Peroxisomal membrane protein PEX14 n=1 Tax=Marasmius oreades TaxID=181124 RepID=A0A9P8ACJ0_9AGAR|nr:uncharacterized protein E1B28_004118 [Marasmius oreades]KAG7096704.1 hypothetical protein E1B28_004118 [Marasmius oreades]
MSEETPSSPQTEARNVQQSDETKSTPPTASSLTVNALNPNEVDRNELVSRARTFLRAPQIQNQDIFAKRKFLIDKGLNEPEIEQLLRELPPQLPNVPPRTYPQLPPSGLPTLLLGIVRLFSWIVGGSTLLLFIYHRFLMPRISQTSRARCSLKTHHLTLLQKLNTSLKSLKEAQSNAFAVLPSPELYKEPVDYSGCHTVDDVLQQAEKLKTETRSLPHITLLRCGIEEFKNRSGPEDSAVPSTEELFQVLESKIPWLVSEDGVAFEHELWNTLSNSAVFESSDAPGAEGQTSAATHWRYIAPEPVPPPPLTSSLETLSSTIFQGRRTTSHQRTLQSLSEFTGYISTQVYAPYRPPSSITSNPLNPTPEDELKKEIRALKGLVLNRRSFLPTIPKTGSVGPS